MQLSNLPGKLVLPFANAGGKSTIPVASQIGITAGAASLTDGFPPLTRTPIAAGGVPPSGLDMNGILFQLSAILRWANAGGGYAYDAAFATDPNVGGYPKGARIMRSDGLGYWFNTVENNTTDPEAAGAAAAGWVPDFTNGVTSVAMASANVTLTPLQYGKPIIVITGTLTANLNLIFPNIVNEWTVINNTTGPYTITCKTAAGTGVVVDTAALIVGDGTNIQSAVTDAAALQLADYAALRAYAGPRKSVYVTGYLASAAPSGIAGMFIRDDSDTTTADNGGTVIVRADGKRYKRPDSGVLNVQWFGAKGDWNGTTGADDTAAIQATLNSLPANFPRVYTVLLPAPVGAYKVSATITNARGGIHIKGEGDAKIHWTGADAGLVFDFGVVGTLTYRYKLSGLSIYGVLGVSRPHCFKFTQVSEFNTDAMSFFDLRDIYTLNRANIGFITDQYCYRPDNFLVGAQTSTAADMSISNGQIFLDKLNVYSCSGHFCDVRSGIFNSLTITNSWIEQFTHLINVAYSGTDTISFGVARLRLENLDVSSFSRLIYAYGSANAVINPFFFTLDIARIYSANKTGTLPWIEINKNGNTHVSSIYGKEINMSSIEIQSSNLSSGVLNVLGGTPNVRVKSITMETPGPLLVGSGVPFDMPKTLFTTAWASTGTQPVLGNGVLSCSYTCSDGVVRLVLLLAMGSTTTYGSGNYSFSLPFTAAADSSALGLGSAMLVLGGGATINQGSALIDNSATTMTVFFGSTAWAPGAPVVLAAGDVMRVAVSYRIAA